MVVILRAPWITKKKKFLDLQIRIRTRKKKMHPDKEVQNEENAILVSTRNSCILVPPWTTKPDFTQREESLKKFGDIKTMSLKERREN